MRALVKTVKSTLIVTSVLLATSASLAAEASGDGRSGDDQAGVSIPVNMDRGITVAQMEKALENCKPIVPSTFLSQLIRQNVSVPFSYLSPSFLLTNPRGKVLVELSTDETYLTANSTSINGYFLTLVFQDKNNIKDLSGYRSFEISDDALDLLAESVYYDGKEWSGYFGFSGGIKIEYNYQEDSGYNQIGAFVWGKQIVTSINVTGETFLSRVHFPFIRDHKHIGSLTPTRLRSGKEKVIECIQNALAK